MGRQTEVIHLGTSKKRWRARVQDGEKESWSEKALCPGTKGPEHIVSPKPWEEEGCPGKTGVRIKEEGMTGRR